MFIGVTDVGLAFVGVPECRFILSVCGRMQHGNFQGYLVGGNDVMEMGHKMEPVKRRSNIWEIMKRMSPCGRFSGEAKVRYSCLEPRITPLEANVSTPTGRTNMK